jgi:hypothetical protein
MQTSNTKIGAHLVANPMNVPRLKSLAIGKNNQNCIAFPVNSPLRHMFAKAIMQGRNSPIFKKYS